MNTFYKKITLIITLIGMFNVGLSQLNNIKIKFIGNCGLHITDGKSNFYVDFPYKSGAHHYMKYDKAEIDSISDHPIFIFTHHHADHYSKKLLKKPLKKKHGRKFDPWSITQLEKLGDSIPEFHIKAFKTKHKVFGMSFKHDSYLITWHGKKIYISGDTDDLEDLTAIKNIDWAFVNPWMYMKALREKAIIDAKKFGIYHLYPNQKIDGEIPSNLLILKNEGEIIQIPY